MPPYQPSLRDLRGGGEWTTAAVLFAFVCWGLWAIASDGNLPRSVIVFALSLIVAAGLFALCRLVGRIVLEKHLHRVRRSAVGSHLVTSVFLVGVGLAHLQQIDWVMQGYHWVVNLSADGLSPRSWSCGCPYADSVRIRANHNSKIAGVGLPVRRSSGRRSPAPSSGR